MHSSYSYATVTRPGGDVMSHFTKSAACLIALAFVVEIGTGCAAIIHGTSQHVAIRSNDSDAELYVNDAYVGKGTVYTVFQKSENYTITVRKEGCEPFSVPVSKSFDAMTLLGLMVDLGVISILVVDGAATGAWSQFDQTTYVLDPRCVAVTPASHDTVGRYQAPRAPVRT